MLASQFYLPSSLADMTPVALLYSLNIASNVMYQPCGPIMVALRYIDNSRMFLR
jgi:hypothetical protein